MFILALAVRVAHVLQLTEAPFFNYLLGDAQGYDQWAQELAAGDWVGSGVFYQTPLYPYAVGVFYAVFGRDLMALRLAQAGIGALSCGLVTLAAAKWFDRRAALFAGLLLACYAPGVFFDGLIQKPVLDGLLVGGFLLALGASNRDAAGPQCFVAGALLGLFVLNRENAVALVPIAAFWMWQQRTRHRLAAVLITLGATALVLAPVAIRNLTVGGELHVTTYQLGPNFYIGNNAGATGTYVPLRPDRGNFRFERLDATEIAEAATGRTLRPSEVSGYWRDRGWDWIRENPGAWLRLTGWKLLLLLNATEAADTEDLATHAEWSGVLRATATLLHFGVLAPLSLLGMWMTRSRWRRLWPLYGFCALFALSVLAFFVLDRYRYPLVPVLALFAGAALAGAAAYWRGSSVGERVKAATLVVIAIIVCNWPLLSSTDMRALTHFNMGVALHKDGSLPQAEAEYRTALRLQPSLSKAHTNLGGVLTTKGDLAEALTHCQEGVRLDPEVPLAHVNLGVVLGSLGRTGEAVEAFTRAVRLDSREADAHYNLGRALGELGQTTAAMEHLREAVRLDPGRAAAYTTLGVLLCMEGQLEEGIAQLRTAVRLDPSSREAAVNLEQALQLAGEGSGAR